MASTDKYLNYPRGRGVSWSEDMLRLVRPDGTEVEIPTQLQTDKLQSRLLGEVWVTDPEFGADPTGTVYSRAAIQAAIDSLPATGGTVVCAGRFLATNIKLDGTNRDKSNVKLRGLGTWCQIRKPAHADLTTDEERRSNVIEAVSGHGHQVYDIYVEGNADRGAINPPFASGWVMGSTWGSAGKVKSVALDGTGGTKTPTDRVVVITALGAGKVSSSVNISEDIAAGYVTEVTNQPWNWTTQTGYNNAYQCDDEYRWGHGIYMNGETEPMENPEAIGVEVTGCRHGGILLAAGPLYASYKGFGTVGGVTQQFYSHDNIGSQVGGGFGVKRIVADGRVGGGTSSGVRFDDGCNDGSISNIIVDGGGDADNGGINLYKSDNCSITGGSVANAASGIWINNCENTSLVGTAVKSSFGVGVSVASSPNTTLTGVNVEGSAGDGLRFSNSKLGTITGGTYNGNGGSGIRLLNSNGNSITGPTCANNGTAGGTVNSGLLVEDSDGNVVVGLKATDANGGSGTQNYGINEIGTSTGNVFAVNYLKQNKLGASVILPGSFDVLNVRSDGLAPLVGIQASGCITYKGGNTNIPTSTPTLVEFGQEAYDSHAIHEGSGTRLTVPENVFAVSLSASITFDPANTAGRRTVRILKNGAAFQGQPEATVSASVTNVVSVQSPQQLKVVPGDFFEVEVWQDSGVAVNVVADTRTWAAMGLK